MARFSTTTVDGSKMRVCVDAPDGDGPYPVVIVMCHIGGLDAFTEDRVEKLAQAGYIAAAPDIFHYHPWIEDRAERRNTLRDKRVLADIEATLALVDRREYPASDKTAILGHCMGGRTSLLGAGTIPRFGPLVMYYGGNTMLSWGEDQGPTPFERIANVRGPAMGFYGMEDANPSPDDVLKIEAEFKKHEIPFEIHRYLGADHAFQNFTNPERYHEEAAIDSWEKTLRFLAEAFELDAG